MKLIKFHYIIRFYHFHVFSVLGQKGTLAQPMWGAARRSARSQTAPTTTRAWPGRGPKVSREGWLRLPHSNIVGVKGGFTRANSLECAVRCETREEDAAGRAAAAVGGPPGGSAFHLTTCGRGDLTHIFIQNVRIWK